MPTAEELTRARELFEAHEPRDLFYRVSLDLLEWTRAGDSDFSVAEALAVVLQTWNRRFYVSKYGARFDSQHFADIEALLARHAEALGGLLGRSIESLAPKEQTEVQALFDEFERVLGPVGAAKALHLLAPRFFPLWDRAIASGAGFWLGKRGTNANRYWRWMLRTQRECREVGGEATWRPELVNGSTS